MVDELRSVNERYEEVLSQEEDGRRAREKAEEEARAWKKKWEGVKVELRNLKGEFLECWWGL